MQAGGASESSHRIRSSTGAARSFFKSGGRPPLDHGPGLAPGKVVGDFRLRALVGVGGMGQIWEAEQLSLGGRRVAVKFVRPERVTERQLELFEREARAGGRLNHPGIVTIHGHGQSDGLAWIAMEFVEGAWTLRDFLDEVARSGHVHHDHDRHVAELVAAIADALQAVHDLKVIHRDLKPQNVLITPDDRPKVTDFGLASITDETALSRTGDFAGTYLYMSPEQVTARRMGLDHRTDIFSLGIVLYELLALQRPFQGDTEHQVAAQIVTKDPPDPRSYRSRVPRDLVVITGKALEKDPDRRYPTMAEFAADLRRFLRGEPVLARAPSLFDRTKKRVRRRPVVSAVLATGLVSLAIITWLWLAAARAREEVLSLSALQTLDDLELEAQTLWPPYPDKLALFTSWLARADELRGELPAHAERLARLRTSVAGTSDATELTAPRDRWWRNQLERLVERIESLHDPERGLARGHSNGSHGWSIATRAEAARRLEEDSRPSGEATRLWLQACAAIADPVRCPAYAGLRLAPQPGLLPLGPDPRSGLWEFAHLVSGAPARRGSDGELRLEEGTGIVLVLLPGGSFLYGAQGTDPRGQNFDPQAESDEGPVRTVRLEPFFLAKHELTQGQWMRIAGSNPSGHSPASYNSRWNRDGRPGTLLHPVEQVSFFACVEQLRRLGLVLPSEERWEYAARGGTDTPWWCGEEADMLQFTGNVADRHAAEDASNWTSWEDWDDGHTSHAPVGSYEPNPFGLHDVIGNVCEWVDGLYAEGSEERVPRGGGFGFSAITSRSAARDPNPPENTSLSIGVRPALDIRP